MARAALALVLLLAAAVPAHTAYSGLTLIPTADLLGPGQMCVDYQLDGPYPVGSGTEAALFNTQFGVGSHVEVGMDLDFTADAPTGALFNAKVLLLAGNEKRPALAVGSYNAGEHLAPTTYAAATLGSGRLRLHLGAQRTVAETQGFGGFDYSLTDRLQLWGEHLAGDENASAVSIAWQITEHWGLSFAWQHPNDDQADDSFSLHLGCMWPAECEGE